MELLSVILKASLLCKLLPQAGFFWRECKISPLQRICLNFAKFPSSKTSWFYKLIQCTDRKTSVLNTVSFMILLVLTKVIIVYYWFLDGYMNLSVQMAKFGFTASSSPSSNESLSRTRLFCREATRRGKLGVGLICRYFQIFRPMWLSSRVTCGQLSRCWCWW